MEATDFQTGVTDYTIGQCITYIELNEYKLDFKVVRKEGHPRISIIAAKKGHKCGLAILSKDEGLHFPDKIMRDAFNAIRRNIRDRLIREEEPDLSIEGPPNITVTEGCASKKALRRCREKEERELVAWKEENGY